MSAPPATEGLRAMTRRFRRRPAGDLAGYSIGSKPSTTSNARLLTQLLNLLRVGCTDQTFTQRLIFDDLIAVERLREIDLSWSASVERSFDIRVDRHERLEACVTSVGVFRIHISAKHKHKILRSAEEA